MINLTMEDQIAGMNWCDVRLGGISWIEDGRDIVLSLLVPPTDREIRLVCRWARGLRIALEFKMDTMGGSLSWDGEVKRGADGTWDLRFDFAETGSLSLVCEGLEIFEFP